MSNVEPTYEERAAEEASNDVHIRDIRWRNGGLFHRLALCVDMLAPEGYGEIIGGGERENNLESLEGRLRQQNLPAETFNWYLDLRRYGSVPHFGFGLGIERTLAWLCGLHHVRETIPFPRLMERLRP